MTMEYQKGFTLAEMLVTLGIAMVLLAGMVSVFVSQTKVSNMMNTKTEAMGDLFLASQIMQSELRGARSICWNSGKKLLLYQPLDSTVGLPNNCDNAVNENGAFELRKKAKDDFRVYWKRPKDVSLGRSGKRSEEMIRNMMPDPDYILSPAETKSPEGIMVSDPANPNATFALGGDIYTWVIVLSGKYESNNKVHHLDLKFKVWPRN